MILTTKINTHNNKHKIVVQLLFQAKYEINPCNRLKLLLLDISIFALLLFYMFVSNLFLSLMCLLYLYLCVSFCCMCLSYFLYNYLFIFLCLSVCFLCHKQQVVFASNIKWMISQTITMQKLPHLLQSPHSSKPPQNWINQCACLPCWSRDGMSFASVCATALSCKDIIEITNTHHCVLYC